METGQIIEIRIEDMLDDGRAFGRCDDLAVFVSGGADCDDAAEGRVAGAVPGDLVRAEIVKLKKNSAEAKLLEIPEASPDRAEAECPFFGECGGCTLQELSYEAQLALKRNQVKARLERLGGLEDPKVNSCIAAENLHYYRNKAVFAVGPHGEVGFKKAKSNFVLDIEDCILQSDAAAVCADALRAFLRERGGKNPGIGQMTVKTAFGTGEVMVVFEEADDAAGNRNKRGKSRKKKSSGKFEISDAEVLVAMLDDAVASLNYRDDEDAGHGEAAASDVNEIADDTSAPEEFWSLESVALINKGKCHIIAGRPTITEAFERGDGRIIRYEIGPQSFFQVNREQMVKLYDKAAEYAELKGGETVLDLYCGAGTIGIWLLDELRSRDEEAFERTKVIGIESVKSAVLDANRNSVINGLVNTRYFAGAAEEELPGMMGLAKLYKWNEVNERVEREPEIKIDHADVAVLDPPRAGCAEPLLDAVVRAAPDRIVYVSCDPATLARDIKYLCASGYEFIECTPVDQFPWTSHIEVVAKIQRR